ncbi:hypothetical protein [Paraclostridium bifermentans]
MLQTCIHHPDIFDKKLNSQSNFYYEHMLSYMDKIIKNGIILDSENYKIFAVINQNIDSWPIKYRKKLKDRIRHLNKSNRIIQLKRNNVCNIDKECNTKNICDIFYSILDEKPNGVIVHSSCFSKLHNNKGNVVAIDSISGSELDKKLMKQSHTIDKDYDTNKFENDIMFPIFKYCKHIKILDRMFGNHIKDFGLEVSDNYKIGLENIVSMIKNSNNNCDKLNIEIYTSIYPSAKNVQQKIQIINNFIDNLRTQYSVNINCYFKKQYGKLSHDRYIFTDQIGVHIGRGIDLFEADGKLRKTTISIVDNQEKRKLETEIKTLSDINIT